MHAASQLWIVMPFINVAKRLGTEVVSPIRINRHVSSAVLYPFVEEGWPVTEKCMRKWRKKRYAASWSSSDSLCKVCHKFENGNPCVTGYVPLASQVNSVLFLICRMQHIQSPCELYKDSRIRSCSLRGLFNGSLSSNRNIQNILSL